MSNAMNRSSNVHVEFAQASIHSEALMSAKLYLRAGCICICMPSMYDWLFTSQYLSILSLVTFRSSLRNSLITESVLHLHKVCMIFYFHTPDVNEAYKNVKWANNWCICDTVIGSEKVISGYNGCFYQTACNWPDEKSSLGQYSSKSEAKW